MFKTLGTSLCLVLFCVSSAKAQMDFASQLMSSGHYEVKKVPKASKRSPASEVTPTEGQVEVKTSTVEVKASHPEVKIIVEDPDPAPAPVQEVAPVPPVAVEEKEPDLGTQVKSLFDGDGDQTANFYKEKIHPEDVRNNKVEIQIASGYSYLDSKANYSYRNYNTAFPVMELRSNVWLTPAIGLSGAIEFSLGGSLKGDATTGSMDTVRDERMELGLRIRRYFGLSRKSSSIEYLINYLDHSFQVSTDSTSHARLRSSGLGIGLKTALPTSAEHAWILTGLLYPKLKHQESKTSISVESGNSSDNVRLQLGFGSEWRMSREGQLSTMFYISSEKNLFTGSASLVDPETGKTPSNVTVTNTQVNFSFGYRWGH